jgi:hypothetical protein
MNGSQVVYGSSTPLVVPLKTNGQRKFHPKTLRAFSVINILLGLISCVLMVISAIIARHLLKTVAQWVTVQR